MYISTLAPKRSQHHRSRLRLFVHRDSTELPIIILSRYALDQTQLIGSNTIVQCHMTVERSKTPLVYLA